MEPITIGLLLGGASALTSAWMGMEKDKRGREIESKTARARQAEQLARGYNPSVEVGSVQYNNADSPLAAGLAGGLQGLGTGLALDQAMDAAKINKALAEAQTAESLSKAKMYDSFSVKSPNSLSGESPWMSNGMPPNITPVELPDYANENDIIADYVMKKRGLR